MGKISWSFRVCRRKHFPDFELESPPRRVEKENMAALIAKKREIFMVQMSLDIKTQEMIRMVQRADQVITMKPFA